MLLEAKLGGRSQILNWKALRIKSAE